ncbi:MAG: SOS response-associated peptidase [Nitrospinae bacterium]|jgi:putative SOS response-associated peptidase YedK|nr:SOS response-associated peptidase [Nitrospinota bacterium]MDA1109039.1 SOS response-associated peptidase [Nitrospinota bacterium]
MCGRYTLTKPAKSIQSHFGQIEFNFEHRERYNIAPTQECPVIAVQQGNRQLLAMRWGLVPPWARDETMAAKMINARAETVQEKPSFKQSFKTKRCLVPADGFIEWKKTASGKQPHYFTRKGKGLFAFAGIWSEWEKDGVLLWTFSLITTACNALVQPIHHRMPVILAPDDYETWLNAAFDAKTLQSLLTPFPANLMEMIAVSQEINSAKNDRMECLQRTVPQETQPLLFPE